MESDQLRQELAKTRLWCPEGRVEAVTGLSLRVSLPGARIGDLVMIQRRGLAELPAEVVGFEQSTAVVVALGELVGVGVEDVVRSSGAPLEVPAGDALLGRVLDGLGRPLDGRPLPAGLARAPVDRSPPNALERRPITRRFETGVRAIDGFLTLGIGQRVGLFAGSGVGKSTLLGQIARGATADAVVVAMVGERGREVGEFLESSLGAGRKRSVMVVATSDASALERLRAAQTATAIAEHWRDAGADVLLLVDSITRFARAQREVGLAAGEPPARRGYPPSVFARLPRLLERAGCSAHGSITALYTVLVEGSDLEEPIADEVRGILDGHIVLSRALGERGRFPAIDIVASLSRLMTGLVTPEHRRAGELLRQSMALAESKRDLLQLGAYAKGSDPLLDRALALAPELEAFLRQRPEELSEFARTEANLLALGRFA